MNKSHGQSESRLYRIWQRMKQESNDYKNNFVAMRRDICDDWANGFSAFSSWAYANGYTDALFLRRRSKFKGYNPDNCYWGTRTGRLYPDDKHTADYRPSNVRTTDTTPTDFINHRFGKLTVIREVPKDMRKPGRRMYVCKCECGNEVSVYASNLLSGATKSCGCLRNRTRTVTATDNGNLRAGRLTILERFEDNGVVKYRCLCDCGNMLGVSASDLFSGRVKSCGCSVTVQEQTTPMPEPVPQQSEHIDIDVLLKALDYQPPTPPNPFDGWDNF